MAQIQFSTTVYPIEVYGDGETLNTAGEKLNSFFYSVSGDIYSTVNTFNDAHTSNIKRVKFDDCEQTVVEYLTSRDVDYTNHDNLIIEKFYQLPVEIRVGLLSAGYVDYNLYQHKHGTGDVTRVLHYNVNTQKWQFANNRALYDTTGDVTGVIGNIVPLTTDHPLSGTIELITNGLFYNFGHDPFKPGQVYFLTDSLPGWLVSYEEGGSGYNVSVPFAVAIHPNAAVLLTDRSITKDLPCLEYCPPRNLRFSKDQVYTEYLDISDGDPFTDPNVIKYSEYTTIAGVQPDLNALWNDPTVIKYNLYEQI